MTDDFQDRFRTASLACIDTVSWHRNRTPAEVFRSLADACDDLGIDQWDSYAERGPVAMLESEVAELLGKESAAFFPSGIMAQQAALRVWSDRAGTRRIAVPDLSHLLHHELDGPRLLHGFEIDHLTTGRQVATEKHLTDLPGRLAAVLVELPLRDAGCLLPAWEDLVALSTAAGARDIRLHCDGARIWEAQPFYDRPLTEIAALADSIYVSFYKGLGGLAGACLAGPEDFVDEARRWRKRMGGTIFRMTPEAVSALVGLRGRLPLMGECVTWARALAAALPAYGVTTHPEEPPTNTFELYAAADVDPVNERLIDFMSEHKLALTHPWRATDVPGRIVCELAIGDAALGLDPAQIATWIGELVSAG
jgi:threonine aldolase